ncbi:MAG: hybrid sensor histidine kinase/response regulator, partial [Burkholderiaceae bacterium]
PAIRKSTITALVLPCLAAFIVFAVLLAARLRCASATIAELRDQRDRDIVTISKARQEALAMSNTADELARMRAALADSQTALAAVRAERDQARRDAEAAHRRRHAFLAGLAHDLRNPLAPLSNGIELLRLTDHDAAGRLRTRGIMERQVGHLLRIADELSDLARLSGDRASVQKAPLELAALLEALADRWRPDLHSQEMTLDIDARIGDSPNLHGDAQRLSQAFGHLIGDLVRHSERGTAMRIRAVPRPGAIDLFMATAADADDAGAPLEDVDASVLSLGVALADQLLTMHGGTLRAQRPPGTRRARFTACLPIFGSPLAAEAGPQIQAPDTAGKALSVLLADDNVDFSHSFSTMLELLGHRVEVVHDGLTAISAIVGSPPDIAFVDIGMPALDGVETVRRVRGQGNAQDVLLVAVTGRGGAEDRARAAEAGFDRYLVKPFAMQDVRDALDAAWAVRSGARARTAGGFAPSESA